MSDTVSTEAPQGEESPTGGGAGQRRMLLVVAGLAGLLVVGLAVYFLFLSGGTEEDLGPVPAGAAPTQGPDDKGNKGGNDDDEGETVPTKVDKDFTVGSNPFEPLPQEAVPVEPVTDDGSDTGTVPDTGGTDPVPQPTVKPTPDPQPTVKPTPDPTKDPDEVTTFKVTLKSVNVKQGTATLEVNGKRYVVKEGKMFTNSKTGPFKLLWVGELPPGKDAARVKFGSEAPVEIIEKDKTVFELPG